MTNNSRPTHSQVININDLIYNYNSRYSNEVIQLFQVASEAIKLLMSTFESEAAKNCLFKCLMLYAIVITRKRGVRSFSIYSLQYICAIIFINRTGCTWRLLPSIFGNYSTVHSWWSRNGSGLLNQIGSENNRIAYLDSTYVK